MSGTNQGKSPGVKDLRAAISAALGTALGTTLGTMLGAAGLAQAGPLGAQVTAGSGQVSQSGNTTTVRQTSQNLSLSTGRASTSAQPRR